MRSAGRGVPAVGERSRSRRVSGEVVARRVADGRAAVPTEAAGAALPWDRVARCAASPPLVRQASGSAERAWPCRSGILDAASRGRRAASASAPACEQRSARRSARPLSLRRRGNAHPATTAGPPSSATCRATRRNHVHRGRTEPPPAFTQARRARQSKARSASRSRRAAQTPPAPLGGRVVLGADDRDRVQRPG